MPPPQTTDPSGVPSNAIGARGTRSIAWLNVAAKALLAGLLAYSVAAPDLPHLAGKAMTARALLYPLGPASSRWRGG